MASEVPDMTLKSVGVVRNEMKEPGGRNVSEIVSEIVIDDDFADALDRLDEYSDIIVLYWYHVDENPGPKPNRVYPHRQDTYPLVGVFALRASDRPNRIGLCVSKLLELQGNVAKVTGLDAIDGSPVIDIKPYVPRLDSRPDATVGPWSPK